MTLSKEQVERLARKSHCPRCDLNKTIGAALCRRCRMKLPEQMRAAANYFDVHFQSVRNFGGGRRR